jgi:uncharacterized protein (DUF2126 family)/transglutaminase-like putative cysteine protease
MAIRVALNHKTHHHYAKEVWLSPHVVRLRPAPHCRTPILSYSLTIAPSEHFINWQQDPYSNYLARLVFPKKAREFKVEVDLVAELTVINPFDFFIETHAQQYPFQYGELLAGELSPYLSTEPLGEPFNAFMAEVRTEKATTIDFLVALNQKLQHRIKYVIRLEPGIQTPDHTLTCLSGSCRDTAWLLVQALRNLGLAARFVSGYLIQLVPDVKPLDGPAGAAQDFTDLHAWVEVYLPGAGWIGLDPTSGLLAGEGHIPLACTAHASSAAAITGFFSPDHESILESDPDEEAPADDSHVDDKFEFAMSVKRIHEDPRVTKPYTDEIWSAINAVGYQVDADLVAHDVRLTMGGEPTFVGIDDPDAAEWNTDAQGPRKYMLADKLIRRVRNRFAVGGFLHHGQGKWYPGESLPRWALGLYWRKDGKPIWRDTTLVADEEAPGDLSDKHARRFITHLAGRLGVEPRFAQPGYEDVWYYLWKEQRLPVNVDPFDSKLSNPEDRKRLAKVFEQGLEKTIGFCLPLRRRRHRDGTGAWVSGPWFFRPERMYLVPGDSAMGFRLPLDSIPWVAAGDFPHLHDRDPMETRQPLPDPDARQRVIPGVLEPRNPLGYVEQLLPTEDQERAMNAADDLALGYAESEGGGTLTAIRTTGTGFSRNSLASEESAAERRRTRELPPFGQSSPNTVRTALCTEVRNGVLRVFSPPLRYIEDYLELVAAIEDTAKALRIPVLVEGYTPPYDPRINQIKVTPDPGVIEVNTVPTSSWDELVRNTEGLAEEARQCRLGTEKFMIDGRHTGTGGGNHIVVGGTTPSDSPLLRRPDLLRSLIGFWHNHPSLSYLFSGLFVGPTSQAPRVDEARNDQVYELDLAFKEVRDKGDTPMPWLVDRIFRNLLVDATGNTHRAEFCIDKLYAPESVTGRLGLLEMRGFEMPPHPKMSLAQHLLLRALIAQFWKEPYEQPLVRWRTEIHDRFMLPHFVHQDLEDIIDGLNVARYPMKTEWFEPHYEFRFPHLGDVEQRGVAVELRQAIEPWHVLGETPGITSTVRYVDSSVERLQIKVDGMTDTRHEIVCNGVKIPMHPTGTNGQFVAGVRYRAWHPAECLHPTIGIHAPLVFDLYDKWSKRSVAGCKYYVSHPGGRSYDTAPINAYEAEGRRIARFFKWGHTPGPLNPIDASPTKEFPLTLDLRRYLS